MIDKRMFAEAARTLDNTADMSGFVSSTWAIERITHELRVDAAGVAHIAFQRGLRVAMMLDGQDPRLVSATEPTRIQLSPQAERLMLLFATCCMDGIAIGLKAAELEGRRA